MAVIEVRHLKKSYPLYSSKKDKLKEALSLRGKIYHKDFEALRGISFSVEKGECVGIIGVNGSGKSTLLKILTGVIAKSSGEANVHGRISALLELGAGYHMELTGRENLYFSGMLYGMTRRMIDEKLPEILAFADLGEYIDQPVKTYSSGMFVRLAFAQAVASDPDVLIIDEALAVGDVFFQKKCYERIREMARNATVLIVSHDMNALTKFSRRGIVLNKGVLIFDGPMKDAVSEYYKVSQGAYGGETLMEEAVTEDMQSAFRIPDPSVLSGQMDLVITAYRYFVDGVPFAEHVEAGMPVTVELAVTSRIETEQLIVGYQIRDRFGSEIFGETNLTTYGMHGKLRKGKSRIRYRFLWPEVREGDYFLTPGLGTGEAVLSQVEQCWINGAIHLNAGTNGRLIYGIFNNQMEQFSVTAER